MVDTSVYARRATVSDQHHAVGSRRCRSRSHRTCRRAVARGRRFPTSAQRDPPCYHDAVVHPRPRVDRPRGPRGRRRRHHAHAQDALGDVVFVDLPAVGSSFKKGEVAGVVESVKAAADLYMPVGGEVVEVNEALRADPSLANTDPLGDGWFFKDPPQRPGRVRRADGPARLRRARQERLS